MIRSKKIIYSKWKNLKQVIRIVNESQILEDCQRRRSLSGRSKDNIKLFKNSRVKNNNNKTTNQPKPRNVWP